LPEKLHIFTSAAVNYLPKVRVLCQSVKRHHPEAVMHLALSDERPAWLTPEGEPFDSILEMKDLDIPLLRAWTFMHSVVELSTAIKPFALMKLLAREDCGAVLYLDPDMVVFSRLDDILATLKTANVALTPHQNKPERELEQVVDNEITSLRMGVFNLGFVGVSPSAEGKRFAQWWADRCYHFCRAEVYNGLFTDQKWINFAPIFFDGVAILKSSRFNVATWNLTTRVMTGDVKSGFTVDGDPLGFYHFTGFDSGAHRIMAFKNAAGNESVQDLIGWYERETKPSANDPVVKTPWAFARFDDGTQIQPQHRWVYRERRDLQAAFPDPYATAPDADGLSYLEWCRTEGRIRFPEFFTGSGPAAYSPPPTRSRVPFGMALRLGLLMFAPHAGKSLRSRMMKLVKREGLRGIARRLIGQPALH
jgi:hypothetical protein